MKNAEESLKEMIDAAQKFINDHKWTFKKLAE